MNRKAQKGFTLIELLVVVTVIGLLAGIAVVGVKNMRRNASEKILRANLSNMRQAIDNFYADKQRFPSGLQELVTEKYMRFVPVDPITKSAETWQEVPVEVEETDAGSSFDDTSTSGPGIDDVKSGAEGTTLDGTPYNEL